MTLSRLPGFISTLLLACLFLVACGGGNSETQTSSTDASLSNLSISQGALSPAFQTATLSYTADVSATVTAVSLVATSTNNAAIIKIDGVVTPSGTASQLLSLSPGANGFNIEVTAEDGVTVQTYTVTVTRAATTSSDASLSAITLSAGALSPAFQSATLNYTATVDASTDQVNATPTTSDANATVTINGSNVASGSASQPIQLQTGDNIITIEVTAEDGVSKENYTVIVTRLPVATGSDSSLSNLAFSTGQLLPAFSPATTTYQLTVTTAATDIIVTPTATDPAASILINGAPVNSGEASQPIALSAGLNILDIDVQSGNGSNLTTYTVEVIRQSTLSNDASLSGLFLSTGSLAPQFDTATANYSATVDQLAEYVLITAIPADSNASITANGASANANGGMVVALAEGANNINVEVTAEDGVSKQIYTLAITRSNIVEFRQRGYLKADNLAANDTLGNSMAISGDTLIVGAEFKKNGNVSFAGAAYIFIRDAVTGIWSQQAYLKANNPDERDNFGRSVAIDGDTAVVGAWGEDSGIPGDETDNSLTSAGAAYVFTRDAAGNWSQQAYLKPAVPAGTGSGGEQFGRSVAIDGDTIVVGADYYPSSDPGNPRVGRAIVFTRSNGVWTQQDILSPADRTNVLSFGNSVAVSGDTAVVGAPPAGSSVPGSGSVYVYTRSGSSWTQQAIVKASVAGEGDWFGYHVALSPTPSQPGDYTLAVSTPYEDSSASGGETDNSAEKAGAAYVFTGSGGSWTQQAFLKASNAEAGDLFGNSIDISGDIIIVGAPYEGSSTTGGETDNSEPEAGAAYVFTRNNGVWMQTRILKASNAEGESFFTYNGSQLKSPGDFFGTSVAVDGDIFAAGAPREKSINGDPANNNVDLVGAAYVFQ